MRYKLKEKNTKTLFAANWPLIIGKSILRTGWQNRNYLFINPLYFLPMPGGLLKNAVLSKLASNNF